jgi:hypothetical protein
LFAEDAQYEGVTAHLTGRHAIRNMYERTFKSGEADELLARPLEINASACLVGIYEREDCVAVKEFQIINGLIVRQSMRA